MYMSVCLYVCMYVYNMPAWWPWILENGIKSSRTRVTDVANHYPMLGTEPESSARVTGALNLWAISAAQDVPSFWCSPHHIFVESNMPFNGFLRKKNVH